MMLHPPAIATSLLVVLLFVPPVHAAAECLVDHASAGSPDLFKTRLSSTCTPAEREARGVDASALLAAVKQGKSVDLDGVVVYGDLQFDALPAHTDPPHVEGILSREDKEIRVVAGAVSIINSVFRGTIIHRSTEGTLIFQGPVTFAGTTFERMVDLSRCVFTQPV